MIEWNIARGEASMRPRHSITEGLLFACLRVCVFACLRVCVCMCVCAHAGIITFVDDVHVQKV